MNFNSENATAAQHFAVDCLGFKNDAVDWFVTGTSAFGPCGVSSDIDICMPAAYRQPVCDWCALHSAPVIPSDYAAGIYITLQLAGTPSSAFNIIFLSSFEHAIWFVATDILKRLPPVPDKIVRHALFESVRASVKLSLGASGIKSLAQYFDWMKAST